MKVWGKIKNCPNACTLPGQEDDFLLVCHLKKFSKNMWTATSPTLFRRIPDHIKLGNLETCNIFQRPFQREHS